jgi:hypothetical protein
MAVKNASGKLTAIIKILVFSFEEEMENIPKKDNATIKRKISDFTLS